MIFVAGSIGRKNAWDAGFFPKKLLTATTHWIYSSMLWPRVYRTRVWCLEMLEQVCQDCMLCSWLVCHSCWAPKILGWLLYRVRWVGSLGTWCCPARGEHSCRFVWRPCTRQGKDPFGSTTCSSREVQGDQFHLQSIRMLCFLSHYLVFLLNVFCG